MKTPILNMLGTDPSTLICSRTLKNWYEKKNPAFEQLLKGWVYHQEEASKLAVIN